MPGDRFPTDAQIIAGREALHKHIGSNGTTAKSTVDNIADIVTAAVFHAGQPAPTDPKHFDPVVLKGAQNLLTHLLTHPEPSYYIHLSGHNLHIDVEIPLDTETMQKIRTTLPSSHWD